MLRTRRPEAGQAAAEYVGILVFVAAIVLIILQAGPGIGNSIKSAICAAIDAACGGEAGPGAGEGTGGGGPEVVPNEGGHPLASGFVSDVSEPAPEAQDSIPDDERAQQEGEQLAEQLLEYDGTNPEVLDEAVEELARHRSDPNFASGFYARLGPKMTQLLPRLLMAHPDRDLAERHMQTLSEAFGAATRDTTSASGFEGITDAFLEVPDDPHHPGLAWERAALLRYADVDDQAWLAEVAKVNMLNRVLAEPDTDRRVAIAANPSLGLPQDALALYLDMLGNNPEASREALSTATANGVAPNDRWSNLSHNIGFFADMTRGLGSGDEIAEGLGNAMQAGAGVHDEVMGRHSDEAARFAYEVFTTVPDHEVGWMMKHSLGAIAGSYAPEITYGSHPIQDHDSAPGAVRNTGVPGLEAAFSLSFDDTYAYVKTFADDDIMSEPFDAAMGRLQEDLYGAAAARDAAELKARDDRSFDNMRRASEQLGLVAGVQHQSQLSVRQELDEADQRVANLMSNVLTFGIGKIPSPSSVPLKLGWMATRYLVTKAIEDHAQISPTRVQLLEDAQIQATLAAPHSTTRHMIDAGVEFEVAPPSNIVDSGGRLLPFGDMLRDPERLVAFNGWLRDNGLGGSDNNALGQQAFSIAASGVGMSDSSGAAAQRLDEDDD